MHKPSIQEQIDYLKDLRENIDGGIEINILALPREADMLRAIQENLIAVKLWDAANTRAVNTGSALLPQDVFEELRTLIATVSVMRDAQKLYDVISSGENLVKKMNFEEKVDFALSIIVQREKIEKREAPFPVFPPDAPLTFIQNKVGRE